MPEISQVRLTVPVETTLQHLMREGGAIGWPGWLSVETGTQPRIAWWGVSGLGADLPDRLEALPSNLFPRLHSAGSASPRGLVLGTVDADRAASDLARLLGTAWDEAADDPVLGARCRVAQLGAGRLVLAEPSTEGYLAACLARFGEGPVAIAIDGSVDEGQLAATNPVNGGPASWVRLGRGTAPYLLFVAAS